MDAPLNRVVKHHHKHHHHSSLNTFETITLQSTPASPTNITPTTISAESIIPTPITTTIPTTMPTMPTIPTIPTILTTPSIPTIPTTPTTLIKTPTIPISSETNTPDMKSTFSTLTPTILGGGNSSAPIIQESDRIPITIAISAFVILFFLSLLFVYVRRNHKKSQQRSLASAIVAAEAGELPSRTTLRDSPSPPPPPPPPPPTPLPHALLDDDENRPPPPRYKISTLQIEPMTRRLTMNLSQKGKSIIVNEGDKRSNQVRRGSANTEDIQDEEECQEIINVISLRDDDDDESSEENEGKGKGKRFSIRKNFWK